MVRRVFTKEANFEPAYSKQFGFQETKKNLKIIEARCVTVVTPSDTDWAREQVFFRLVEQMAPVGARWEVKSERRATRWFWTGESRWPWCFMAVWPHRRQPNRLHHPWDSPGKNTGVGCHFLLQGIFPTQELNPGLLHCRKILYHWVTRKVHFND